MDHEQQYHIRPGKAEDVVVAEVDLLVVLGYQTLIFVNTLSVKTDMKKDG